MKRTYNAAIVGALGVILIGFAIWITKTATPLWGLILVAGCIDVAR